MKNGHHYPAAMLTADHDVKGQDLKSPPASLSPHNFSHCSLSYCVRCQELAITGKQGEKCLGEKTRGQDAENVFIHITEIHQIQFSKKH